jgi:hypothetical protein
VADFQQPKASGTTPSRALSEPMWRSPIEFQGGGVHGSEFLVDFRSHVAKTISALPEVGPAWWIERSIMQSKPDTLKVGSPVDVGEIFCDVVGLISLKLMEVSSDFVRVAQRYHLEFKDATTFTLTQSLKDLHIPISASEVSQERTLAVPLIPIPNERDPRIFQPDIGTHQSCSGTLEQWRDLMEWEGRTDAEMVLKYLNAYNNLIQNPTVENLQRATENPRTSTDSYFLAMKYIGETFQLGEQSSALPGSPQRAVFDFLGLLHMTFFTSYADTQSGKGNSLFPDSNRRLLAGLLDSFIASH